MLTKSSSRLVPVTRYTMVRGSSTGTDGGEVCGAVGAGVVVGAALGGGASVVTVSRGSGEVGGSAVGCGGRGGAITLPLGAGPTVAEVDVLSPPLTIRAVARSASASTPAATSATGRQRLSRAPA